MADLTHEALALRNSLLSTAPTLLKALAVQMIWRYIGEGELLMNGTPTPPDPAIESFITTKYLTQSISIPSQPLDDVMVQTVDFFDIAKFLCATHDNLSRLETTKIEEIRDSSFTVVHQQRFNALPYILTINGFLYCKFCRAAGH